MVIPEEYKHEFWNKDHGDNTINLTCLMPNGLIIFVAANPNATFAEIKEDLWEEAVRMPMYGSLHNMSVYIFTYVNAMAEMEPINDESRQLAEVRPIGAVLKVSECIGDMTEKDLNLRIGSLIGKRLPEFDALSSAEINDFRFKMRKLGDENALQRQKQTWTEKLLYHYPPRISPSNQLETLLNVISQNQNQALQNNTIIFSAQLEFIGSFKLVLDYKKKPADLLIQILNKKAITSNCKVDNPADYVLKVFGNDEYLIGDTQLIDFEYVRECISRDTIPSVVVTSKTRVPIQIDHVYDSVHNFTTKKTFSTLTLGRKKGTIRSSWDISNKFMISLSSVGNFNYDIKRSPVEIGIQVGLFHGGKSLCQPQKTTEKFIDKLEFSISENLMFDIQICNIPRSAKLCFAIYEVTKSTKSGKNRKTKENSNKEQNPIAWANTTVFDYKNQLKTGAMTLYMWTYAEEMTLMSEDLLHPLGTVVTNPLTKSATALTVTFDNYGHTELILYPLVEQILNYVEKKNENDPFWTDTRNIYEENRTEVEECLKLFVDNEQLYDIHDQDRKRIWKYRKVWKEYHSDVLPKFLHIIEWENREEVSDIVYLLQDWPSLAPINALELLDYAYADTQVRNFAVKCINKFTNDDLLLYLLQLVQALKHELVLDCDLVKFLLKRALNNQKIGHYLFWHLRSEMQMLSVSVRFGLILEAYCRGSQDHIYILAKQLECLEKLKSSNILVRAKKDKEKAKADLQKHLNEPHCIEAIKDLTSPLDPSFRCSKVQLDKLRVMDSKMRPLWVVFENVEKKAQDIYIIFKSGDDLRQDMLTLQMLRIMDRLWKQEGLDLRMNPYKCISMEYRIGMIEVVLNAETIANIQKEKGMFSATSAFKKGSILAWLKDYNTTEASLKKAVNEFTLSCAGYCVATYILGVADRHSDNIMVKKTGQLFHIDYGHILGHFKEKFGFKRERVPFVLTHDFVHVISKGQKDNLEFKIFQSYCEQAFLILRKHGGLILSLFAMMISTGLPELSSEKDLNYLKETLVLSKSNEDALKHFKAKFDEALRNSWKTSMNWATHNVAKNNKTY